MTPLLDVGTTAVCRTGDVWEGRTVVITAHQGSGYLASDGWDEQYFTADELEYLPPAPSVFDRAWVRVAVLVVAFVVLALAVWGAR